MILMMMETKGLRNSNTLTKTTARTEVDGRHSLCRDLPLNNENMSIQESI